MKLLYSDTFVEPFNPGHQAGFVSLASKEMAPKDIHVGLPRNQGGIKAANQLFLK